MHLFFHHLSLTLTKKLLYKIAEETIHEITDSTVFLVRRQSSCKLAAIVYKATSSENQAIASRVEGICEDESLQKELMHGKLSPTKIPSTRLAMAWVSADDKVKTCSYFSYSQKLKQFQGFRLRLGSRHFFDDYPGHCNPTSVGIAQGIASTLSYP